VVHRLGTRSVEEGSQSFLIQIPYGIDVKQSNDLRCGRFAVSEPSGLGELADGRGIVLVE